MPFPFSDDSRISRFYDYWNSLRAGGAVPGQRVFDPAEIGPLLPNIWIARWDQAERDFVYRLAGEQVLTSLNRPLRLRTLRDAYGEDSAAVLRERYQQVCAKPAILHAHGNIYEDVGRHGVGERLILPMRDCDGRPTTVIGCSFFTTGPWPRENGAEPASARPEIRSFLTLDAEPLQRLREAC